MKETQMVMTCTWHSQLTPIMQSNVTKVTQDVEVTCNAGGGKPVPILGKAAGALRSCAIQNFNETESTGRHLFNNHDSC